MNETGIIKLKKKRNTQLLSLKIIKKYISCFDTSVYDQAQKKVKKPLLEQVLDVLEKVQVKILIRILDRIIMSYPAQVEFENIYLETKVQMRIIRRKSIHNNKQVIEKIK